MRQVGVPDIMQFLATALPQLAAQVERNSTENPDAENTSNAFTEYREAFDRWAGQYFPSDTDRLSWWNANKSATPEQWLRTSLPLTARRADTQLPDARLFHELLLDAPWKQDPKTNIFTPDLCTPYRQQWFLDHQPQLQYSPTTGTFQIPR